MKNYTDFKVGDKVLVKDNYITLGDYLFNQAMQLWKKTPVEIVDVRDDDGRVLVRRLKPERWTYAIRMVDLIPFRPKSIFNK